MKIVAYRTIVKFDIQRIMSALLTSAYFSANVIPVSAQALQLSNNIQSAESEQSSPVGDAPLPRQIEAVMAPRMEIIARTSDGAIKITAGKGLKRIYEWKHLKQAVQMYTTRGRYHNGCLSRGLFCGDYRSLPEGIRSFQREESQINFSSLAQVLRWLELPNALRRPTLVYRNGGFCRWM